MLKIFIKRPVLSTVISVIIVLLGIIGLLQLPLAQYPDISPPTIQVSASYTGASADVVMKSVIIPLEEQINGVEGMSYMTSTATNQGSATINVYFKIGTDPNMDAVNVQNRVSVASSVLPATVTEAGVTVTKQQSSMLVIAGLYSDNPNYDENFLQNYAEINLIPALKRVTGVGNANAFGSHKYSMRIWLKPDVMASYGLTPDDVNNALAEQNVQAAPGQFGERGNQSFQYVIQYTGTLTTIPEYENIVVKAKTGGQVIRLKDIARVELGAQDYSISTKTNGKPATMMAVSQLAGSNANEVIKGSLKVFEDAGKSLPAGVHYVVVVDINKFLNTSIHKVIETLIECFLLVFLVIFIFLQDVRSTVVHGISVPVAIIGTFFVLYILGYSINLLTLFAMVLAIGIVVDDAIVVVEAVHAKLENGYTSPKKAAIDAMSEIYGAIISITLVMASVFIPVTFIGGSTGVFFKQFGVTLAAAILISAINALTLCPALAALFLRPPNHGEHGEKRNLMQRFAVSFNAGYNAMSDKYTRSVRFLSRKVWIAVGSVVIFGIVLIYLMRTTPSSFVPNEDMGTIFVNVTLPTASSMERTTAAVNKLDSIFSGIPQVQNRVRLIGDNFLAGAGSSYAMLILELKDWDKRKGVSNNDVINELRQRTKGFKDADLLFMSLPTITGFGALGGFEFQLEDKAGHTTAEFYKVAQNFLGTLNKRPEIMYAATSFDPRFPQYLLSVDVVKCKAAGIAVTSILDAMQYYYGGFYSSNFTEFGKQYRVYVQADTNYRAKLEGLSKIYVRGSDSTMAPISTFITMKRIFGPQSLNRFNLFSSMSVSGSPNPNFSTGQALQAIKETAAKTLPSGYGFEFSGISLQEQESGTTTVYIFIMSLVFVYFLLSALYESYVLPFAVIFSLPIGLAGEMIFIKLFGIDKNIYVQIAMIMLIGLLAKNAILIVEFAIERRRLGMGLVESAIEGARVRLRPILMTSFAFICGLIPLMFATGAGANGNRSLGTSAVGGMLIGTLLGVFVTPVLYILFQGVQERLSGPAKPLDADDPEDEPTPPAGNYPKGELTHSAGNGPGGLKNAMVAVGLVLTATCLLPSCKITQPYSKPVASAGDHYRDQQGADTTTIANLPWPTLFNDTVLQKLIREGMAHNLDLLTAVEKIKESESTLRQAKAAFLPSLDANGTVSIQKLSSAQTYGISVPTTPYYEAYLSSSWTADIWGQLRSTKKAALASLLQTVAARQAAQTQLIAEIAVDYYMLLAYDKELAITRQTVENRKVDVSTMKKLMEGDVVTGADVVESEANLHSAEVSEYDYLLEIRQTENALSILLGRAPGSIERTTLEEQHPIDTLQTGIPTQLLQNRPDVLEAEYNFRNAFENTNVARTYFYPSLTITAEGGLYTMGLKDFFDASNLFGTLAGALTQPIFAQGANKARLQKDKALQNEALYSYQSTLLNAGSEVSNYLYSYQLALKKQVVRTDQIQSLEKAVNYTKKLLQYTSSTNYNDVLTSEQNLLTAQLSSVADKLQQLQSIVNLYVALGGGWR